MALFDFYGLFLRKISKRSQAVLLPRVRKSFFNKTNYFGFALNQTRIAGFVGRRFPSELAGPGMSLKLFPIIFIKAHLNIAANFSLTLEFISSATSTLFWLFPHFEITKFWYFFIKFYFNVNSNLNFENRGIFGWFSTNPLVITIVNYILQ